MRGRKEITFGLRVVAAFIVFLISLLATGAAIAEHLMWWPLPACVSVLFLWACVDFEAEADR